MSTPVPSGAAALTTLRILVGSLLSSAVFITVAVYFVLGTKNGALDLLVLALAPLLLGVAVHGVCEAVGYRMRAIAPGTAREQAGAQSREAFQLGTMLRFALCESVLIISLAAGFVVGVGGFLVFLVGAVTAIALVGWHCWPTERIFRRCQESLERDGAQSFLREAYGLTPARGGAIKEL